MVLVKNWQFFYLFNIGKIGQEILFENIVARQKIFPDYKNKRLKKWKNWDFFKGVSPWFWSKIGNFSTFLISAKYARKISLRIFQTIKTRILQSGKIGIFPKGLVDGFGQKLAIFLCF